MAIRDVATLLVLTLAVGCALPEGGLAAPGDPAAGPVAGASAEASAPGAPDAGSPPEAGAEAGTSSPEGGGANPGPDDDAGTSQEQEAGSGPVGGPPDPGYGGDDGGDPGQCGS